MSMGRLVLFWEGVGLLQVGGLHKGATVNDNGCQSLSRTFQLGKQAVLLNSVHENRHHRTLPKNK